MNELIYNDEIVQSLSQAIVRGEAGLSSVPGLVKMIVDGDLWKRRLVGLTGQVVEFASFAEFAVALPPEGLGADIATLERLCHDDKVALDTLDRAIRHPRGGDRRSAAFKRENQSFEKSPSGNSTRGALRRLTKERPDLHSRVLRRELTANAAMVEAGFRQHRVSIYPDDVERTSQILRRHLDKERIEQLVALLAD